MFILTLYFSHSLASVIRGQVLTADGTPLIGVNVSFFHYPEYGYTITRQDGICGSFQVCLRALEASSFYDLSAMDDSNSFQ